MMFVKSLLTLRLLASGAMHTVVHFFYKVSERYRDQERDPKDFRVPSNLFNVNPRHTIAKATELCVGKNGGVGNWLHCEQRRIPTTLELVQCISVIKNSIKGPAYLLRIFES